jgi:hypothetical protein
LGRRVWVGVLEKTSRNMKKSEPKPVASGHWLKRRQELSWEPEILISGIVLYALFQLPDWIDRFQQFLNNWSLLFYFGMVDETVAAILKTSVYFLISGLVINLVFRSIWVGMIGLSYVFPKGIHIEKLKLIDFFETRVRKLKSYPEAVRELDRVCSTIYSATFLLFMATLGVTLFLFGITLLAVLPLKLHLISIHTFSNHADLFLLIMVLVFGLVYFLDFVTLGWLKRIKWLAVVYRPIYVCMSVVTLAPLYRGIYYGLISNFNRWKIGGAAVIYVVLFFVIVNHQRGGSLFFDGEKLHKNSLGVTAYDGYYRDMNPKKHSSWISIQSMKIGTEPIEVFLPYKNAFEDSIVSRFSRKFGIERREILEKDSLALASIRDYFSFRLDGKKLPEVDLFFINWSTMEKKGLIGFIPTDSLSAGNHYLELWVNNEEPVLGAKVPFFSY